MLPVKKYRRQEFRKEYFGNSKSNNEIYTL